MERSDDVGHEAEAAGLVRRGSHEQPAWTMQRRAADVAGVLNAAEEAAETIRDRGPARRPTRSSASAKADAEARVEELTREAAARSHSRRTNTRATSAHAVDSYGTQARREAEEEARKLLADAEEQARATREAAQEMASQIEADAQRRHESLVREAKSLEERRQRVLDGLRDLAAQLQDALVEPTSRDDGRVARRRARRRATPLTEPGDELRTLLRGFPTGVAVLTVDAEGERLGLTVSALVSLSLEPPLVGVGDQPAGRHARASARSTAGSRSACWRETRRRSPSTSPAACLRSRTGTESPPDEGAEGAPLIDDALGWLECRLADEHDAGDHTLFVGEVLAAERGRSAPPLVYLGQRYVSMDA